MRNATSLLTALAATGALAATSLAVTPGASASPQRRALAGTAPTWVARAQSLGPVGAGTTVTTRVYLAPRGGTQALKAAVRQVSDPKSRTYRQFLTARQFHRRFDAPSTAVAEVSRYLRAHHVSVTGVESHRRYVVASGSVASVQRAFGVSLQTFRRQGRLVRANTRPVILPTSVGRYVTTVTGLDTTPRRMKPAVIPPPPGFRNARPCSRYYGQLAATYQADYRTKLPAFAGKRLPYAVCGYTGPQLRSAYEGDSDLDGTGVTVAIIDAFNSPTIAQDAATYAANHGDGDYAPGQLTQVVPAQFAHTGATDCGPSGWFGEQSLDVEAVHAMAPSANIRYYAAKSCYDEDILATQAQVVDENRASIVSNSYGLPEEGESAALVAASQQVFLQGALQGIGFVFSSGDQGDELANTGIKQADASANDPYVTADGGTADAIGPTGSFLFQTGWGTVRSRLNPDGTSWLPGVFTGGAGGGNSSVFNKPDYQDGVVPNRFGQGRAVPDVAMTADPTTGMLIGHQQAFPDGAYYSEYRVGGTSLASPLFAGMTALLSQHAETRLGFLNPLLYSQAGTPVLTDVKGAPADAGNVRSDFANGLDASGGLIYSVREFNRDSSLVTGPGWDEVTGVGSPRAGWLTSVSP